MYAGIFIGLAAIVYVRCENPIVGAVLFSVGLLACLLDYNERSALCTGRANQPWHALLCKKDPRNLYPWYQMFGLWWTLFAINGFFALWMGVMARLCIDCGKINAIMEVKLGHPWYWILFMGFLCGLLIQVAVHAFKGPSNYWPIVVLCVAAFLVLGGEHCIADAAFIGMWQSPGGWENSLACIKLVMCSAVGNLLAGALFYNKV